MLEKCLMFFIFIFQNHFKIRIKICNAMRLMFFYFQKSKKKEYAIYVRKKCLMFFIFQILKCM